MALATAEATFNAAVDTLMDAWETIIDDGLAANEIIKIVWCASKKGDNPADSTQGSDATVVFDQGRRYEWKNNPNTAADTPFEIGGRPLFFKLTDDAGGIVG